jgi:phosphoglucomutase
MIRENDGSYVRLTGTQVGAILCDYLIQANREKGTLPANAALVTTVVTGTLAERICEANGVHVERTLTGFKYIGEKMEQWKNNGEYGFLFGFEESYGYLAGGAAHDKDAVLAAALLAETALYHKLHGRTLLDVLNQLYDTYGPVADNLYDHYAEGASGTQFIKNLMMNARKNARELFAGETLAVVTDFQTGVRTDLRTGAKSAVHLPLSNVLKFEFADTAWVVLRPSGTEPKIKLYVCSASAFPPHTPFAEAEKRVQSLRNTAVALLIDSK